MRLFKKKQTEEKTKTTYYVAAIQWYDTGNITNEAFKVDDIDTIAQCISESTGKVWNKDFGVVNVMPQ